MQLLEIDYDDLICLALRHRWIPYEGEAGVVDGKRIIRWRIKCESGCNSRASEWRDLQGVRVPGTQRQYYLTDRYSQSTGYMQSEYFTELHRRNQASRQNRAG